MVERTGDTRTDGRENRGDTRADGRENRRHQGRW